MYQKVNTTQKINRKISQKVNRKIKETKTLFVLMKMRIHEVCGECNQNFPIFTTEFPKNIQSSQILTQPFGFIDVRARLFRKERHSIDRGFKIAKYVQKIFVSDVFTKLCLHLVDLLTRSRNLTCESSACSSLEYYGNTVRYIYFMGNTTETLA